MQWRLGVLGLWLLNAGAAQAVDVLAVHQGQSSFYQATGGGACGFEPSRHDLMVAALNVRDYADGALCGAYLRISGPRGDALVRVVDQCPGCKHGGLDLSKEAFAKVADPKRGREQIRWQVASPELDSPLQYHFKAGSSAHWLGIQIRNHRNPVAKLEYQGADGRWHAIARGTHGYFVNKDPQIGPGPYTFRVTDMFGGTVVDRNIPLRAGVNVASAQQLPDAAGAAHLASAGGRWLSEDEANNMVEPLPGAGRWQQAADKPAAAHKPARVAHHPASRWATGEEVHPDAARWANPVAQEEGAHDEAAAQQVAARWAQEGAGHVAAKQPAVARPSVAEEAGKPAARVNSRPAADSAQAELDAARLLDEKIAPEAAHAEPVPHLALDKAVIDKSQAEATPVAGGETQTPTGSGEEAAPPMVARDAHAAAALDDMLDQKAATH